jgi:GTP-binding protein HflX
VEDKLFATLDTTVRAMHPETKPRVLISDTVGFIQKLPHDLVASFRSTLDEAKEASLLLLVVDASDVAFRRQMEVVREVLEEIGAGELPLTLVLNKIDQVDELHRKLLRKEFPGSIQMSALEANDVERLKQYIISHFQADMVEADFVIPYEASNLVGEIRRQATVVSETHDEESLIVRVRATPRMMERLQESLERMMESVSEEE